MPVPTICQPISDAIRAAISELDTLRASLPTLPPQERWIARAQIGRLERRMATDQPKLDACLREHQAAYRVDVATFDTSGGAPPSGPRRANLWRVFGDAVENIEQVELVGDAFTLTRHHDESSMVVTVGTETDPAIQGPDFRSSLLGELPGSAPYDPDGHIEIVVGSGRASADEVLGWLATLQLPQVTTIPMPVGEATITLTGVTVQLGTGHVLVSIAGEAKAPGPAGLSSGTFKLSSARLELRPRRDPLHLCELLVRRTPNIELGGALGLLPPPLASMIRDSIVKASIPQLEDAFDVGFPRGVAAWYGLDELPPGVTASVRSLTIAPSEISITAAIGAFGDVLSTFAG